MPITVTSAKEFGGGFAVGGILGAGQMGGAKAVNSALDYFYRTGNYNRFGKALKDSGAESINTVVDAAKGLGGEAEALARRLELKQSKGTEPTIRELGELYIKTMQQANPENAQANSNNAQADTENARNSTENVRDSSENAAATAENAAAAGQQNAAPMEGAADGRDAALDKADAAKIVSKLRQSLPELQNEPTAASLSGSEFAKGAKKLTEQVGDFFRSLGNSVFRKGLGNVIIDERGVKSDIAHGIGRAKAVTFAAVPAVIEHGRQIDYQENWEGRGV